MRWITMLVCSTLLWTGCQQAGSDAEVVEAVQGPLPMPEAGDPIDDAIRLANDIRPVRTDLNHLPGGIDVIDQEISGGRGFFANDDRRGAPKNLQITGIYETPGTRIVQVDVSRASSANIFGDVRKGAAPEARLQLVDSTGARYSAVGYVHEKSGGVDIAIDTGSFYDTFDALPSLPSAGEQKLRLVFQVTSGRELIALVCGTSTVGSCSLAVPTS